MMPGNVKATAALSDRLDEVYREALYADCSEQDVTLCRALLVREPSRPALTRLKLSESRSARGWRGPRWQLKDRVRKKRDRSGVPAQSFRYFSRRS